MTIDGSTRVFALIGSPVEHSLSPAMHNAGFAALGLNAVYVAFRVEDVAGALRGVRALNLGGLSVTVPHKVAVMAHLDQIEETARQVGAVNTVVVRDGRLVGYNTDVAGAMAALSPHTDFQGRRFLIVGAGGAARAIGFGLWQRGAHVTIANRSEERGRSLAADLACPFVPLADAVSVGAECIIQATSVGMAPGPDKSPVSPQVFRPGMVVMDIVYKPRQTRFLREAAERGCRCIGGLTMLLEQAVEQCRLWTGQTPREAMTAALQASLNESGAGRVRDG